MRSATKKPSLPNKTKPTPRPSLDVQVVDLVFNPINLRWTQTSPGVYTGDVAIGRNVVPIGRTEKPLVMRGKFLDGRISISIRRNRKGVLTQVRQIYGRNRRGWIDRPLFSFEGKPIGMCE